MSIKNENGTVLDKEGNGMGMELFLTENTNNGAERDGLFSTKNTKNGTEPNEAGTIGKRRNGDGTI